MNPNTFRNLSYGVYVISTWDNGRPTGCTVNSVMQITSSPATIAVSVNHDNFTNTCISETKRFSISILSEASAPSLIGTFGFQSGKDVDKFADVPYKTADFLPILEDSCGYITLKVVDTMETTTHTIFLGEVIGAEILDGTDAMTYAYYHKVIKGKSPKNAPTYLPENSESSDAAEEKKEPKTYVCQVCGYKYKGEKLPEDFICPICGKGADKFIEE